MVNLNRASQELFRRTPDECFPSLSVLSRHCQWQKEQTLEVWQPPRTFWARPVSTNRLVLASQEDQSFQMNDWSFGQLCRLAGVAKETVNRLTSDTASKVLAETLPRSDKPLQLFTTGDQLRSIHPASYTRLYNADLLAIVQEFAVDFEPPQTGINGMTGLYAGEQDMFCFLIDPLGWTEIDGQAFAPGFFIWNSEVGCRSVGVETFWFQAVCRNHIVWDAVEVVDFARKHTANVHDALNNIRRIIENLVAKRDARRDQFSRVIRRAMQERLGNDADEAMKALAGTSIPRTLAKQALEIAQQQGGFTIFALVDALTRMAGTIVNAGERLQADQRAASLLALAA